MVYKPHPGDIVLARFFIGGDSGKSIRFVKRKGKFYRIDDITHYRPEYKIMSTGVTHIDTIVEIEEPSDMLVLINAALNATLNGEEETYEIWINDSIHDDMFKNG